MRRIVVLLVLFICLASLVSCASGMIDKYPLDEEPELEVINADYIPLEGEFENESYHIRVTSDGTNINSYFCVIISNKTMDILSVDGNKIVYSNGVKSTRLVDGTTRKINSNLAQADVVVAPKSITTVNLFTADESFISTAFEGSLFFSIDDGSGAKTIGVELKKSEAMNKTVFDVVDQNTDVETTIVCRVSDKGTLWHPFFIGPVKTTVCNRLLDQAKEKYGEDATLANIDYEITWRPLLSMLFYFDMLGYVQKYKATADVVVPK